ncbi:MAG TPA: fumarylacetoacetate hydrolase family protein [Actinomycetota bacterium]|nr:fumarylacetoacetate hydrolase family protein [Actinomycetota bacterium]
MRLVTFSSGDTAPRTGALVDGTVVDLADAGLPRDMIALIEAGGPALEATADASEGAGARFPLDDVRLHAPVPRPPKNVMCVGRNYAEHATEFSRSGFDASERSVVPPDPVIFTKAVSSIIGPEEPILLDNDPTGTVDYEGELAVVIGRGGRRIAVSDAAGHVFGYTIVNDVTARDLQQRHVQWFLGKSVDTFCPMGPTIVTPDELPDVGASWLRTRVNGDLRQEAPISDLIFDVPALISTISATTSLEPGDVIATGTPAGAGIGSDPPRYLERGDHVEVSIDGIGTLVNPVR